MFSFCVCWFDFSRRIRFHSFLISLFVLHLLPLSVCHRTLLTIPPPHHPPLTPPPFVPPPHPSPPPPSLFILLHPLFHPLLHPSSTSPSARSIFLEPIRPPLDFLGLLQCKACEFRNLPARRVAGHHFAEGASNQVLTAVHNYQDKVDLLVKALQYLFQVRWMLRL